jgi:hypothetical protein
MGEVISFPKIEIPLDLDDEDITAIIDWMNRSEGWGAKFARISHRPGLDDKRWAYVFRCGPTSDACPIITITRTSLEYSVVVWDVLDCLASGAFAAQAASTISEALDIVTEEVSLGATQTAGRGEDQGAPSDKGALHAITGADRRSRRARAEDHRLEVGAEFCSGAGLAPAATHTVSSQVRLCGGLSTF